MTKVTRTAEEQKAHNALIDAMRSLFEGTSLNATDTARFIEIELSKRGYTVARKN
jgi:hypothetical protein